MPNSTLTVNFIREEIQLLLGAGGVEIELTPKQMEAIARDIFRKYNRYRPMHGRAALTVNQTTKKYEITQPGLQGVLMVDFVDAYIAGSKLDPFSYESRNVLNFDGDTYGALLQADMYIEEARRIMSVETEWLGQWEGDKYYLYIDISRDLLCSYRYTWHITRDDNAVTGMQFVPDGDTDWIIDYGVAKAKEILGRVRTKRGGIIGSDGNTQEIDGPALLQEGRDDQKELIESIKKRRPPLPPVLG